MRRALEGLAHHVAEVNLDGRRDPQQGLEGGVAHPPFDVADHLLGEPGALRDLRHRETPLHACPLQDLDDAATGRLLGLVGRHMASVRPASLDKTPHHS